MTTLQKILQVLGWCFGNIIYIITFIIPKKNNLWVFGSWFGQKYVDNSKYLFEYVCKNHPEINAIWVSKSTQTTELVKNKGYNAIKSYSLKGTWYSMRAKVGIVSHWTSDLNLFTISNMKIVQLWHGTPLKKIGFDDAKQHINSSKLKEFLYGFFPFLKKDFSKSLITIPSIDVGKIFSSAFKAPLDNMLLTGYARNDVFFQDKPEDFPIREKLLKMKENVRIGVYLPTHRQKGKSDITKILSEKLDKVNSDLENIGAALFIKFHYYDLQYLKEKQLDFSNIIFLKDDDINHDIYPLLALSDFLVTDYSSIFFDYLLTDRPIVFAPFDYDKYLKEEREFYFDYEEVTPGPKAYNWAELADKIQEALDDSEIYRQKRKKVRDRFNHFVDGQNSRRIFDQIIRNIS